MPGSNASVETEEGGNGSSSSDDESGMRGSGGLASSTRWSRMSGGTKGWRLRGVEWRVKLGILPGGSATVDDMRRATADGRRRYADLRRRLLVDPHIMDDGQMSSHLSMDNPLSLDPESVWGRYFRNAELEKTIEKDLTRLYPEHGVFFQSAPCQAMMRRILLVWSLIHPKPSYRQGMHELLAPLLYVLHVDVVRLSQVKHRFEDLFDDRFDSLSLQEQHVRDKVESAKNFCGEMIVAGDSINFNDKVSSRNDSSDDPEEERVDLSVIIQGSDMYGVEGELGALLSARFLEHDAYCMLDALLSGQGGAVAMSDFFSTSSGGGKPPIIEASAAVFRTLAAAEISVYTHLVDLGVEPQFFALRWLRLLFGREFVLEDLLRVWDAIFGADNTPLNQGGGMDSGETKFSQRSALISSMSVSMLLYVRPALLAAPDATACLQRLLNFPQVPDVRDLIESAKSLQLLAQAASKAPGPPVPRNARASEIRGSSKHGRSGSTSPPTPKHHVVRHHRSIPSSPEVLRVSMSLPGSYWEEKWTHSVLQQKSPEELLSPMIRTEAGSRGFDNMESSSAVLIRTGSEGRHQTVRADLPTMNLSVKIYESFPDSSDDDGQEMLRRCGGILEERSSIEDLSAANARDSDSSRQSDDQKEQADDICLNPEVDLCLTSDSSSLEQQQSHPDRTVLVEDSVTGQSGQTDGQSTSGLCDMVSGDEGGRNAVDGDEDPVSATLDLCNERHGMHQAFGALQLPSEDCQVSRELFADDTVSSIMEPAAGSSCETQDMPHNVVEPMEDRASSPAIEDDLSHLLQSTILQSDSPDLHGSMNIPSASTSEKSKQNLLDEELEDDVCSTSSDSPSLDQPVDKDSSRSVDSALPPSRGKPPLPPSRLSRFNWMWSLGRNSTGDKTLNNKLSKEEAPGSEGSTSSSASETDISASTLARKKKSWWRPNNDVVPEESMATTSSESSCDYKSDLNTNDDCSTDLEPAESVKHICEPVVLASEVQLKDDALADLPVFTQETGKKPKDVTPSAALQALGQSVLEHVQVLESVLAQKVSVLAIENMMWTPAVRDKSESINKAGLGGKGHVAALAAIAELRKISQALQQM